MSYKLDWILVTDCYPPKAKPQQQKRYFVTCTGGEYTKKCPRLDYTHYWTDSNGKPRFLVPNSLRVIAWAYPPEPMDLSKTPRVTNWHYIENEAPKFADKKQLFKPVNQLKFESAEANPPNPLPRDPLSQEHPDSIGKSIYSKLIAKLNEHEKIYRGKEKELEEALEKLGDSLKKLDDLGNDPDSESLSDVTNRVCELESFTGIKHTNPDEWFGDQYPKYKSLLYLIKRYMPTKSAYQAYVDSKEHKVLQNLNEKDPGSAEPEPEPVVLKEFDIMVLDYKTNKKTRYSGFEAYDYNEAVEYFNRIAREELDNGRLINCQYLDLISIPAKDLPARYIDRKNKHAEVIDNYDSMSCARLGIMEGVIYKRDIPYYKGPGFYTLDYVPVLLNDDKVCSFSDDKVIVFMEECNALKLRPDTRPLKDKLSNPKT